jgi:hypothetical protein
MMYLPGSLFLIIVIKNHGLNHLEVIMLVRMHL